MVSSFPSFIELLISCVIQCKVTLLLYVFDKIYPTCESILSTCASSEDNPAHGIYCTYPCRSTASQGVVGKVVYLGSNQFLSILVCMWRNCFDLFCYQNQALVKTHSLFTDPISPQERRHPSRRSQSGREKGRDESFKYGRKSPRVLTLTELVVT